MMNANPARIYRSIRPVCALALSTGSALACAAVAVACGGQLEPVDTQDEPSPRTPASGESPTPSTSPSAAPTTVPVATPHSDAGASTPAGARLSGTGTFIALFPVADGALVVASDGVRRIGRDGAVAASWTTPREITAAAFNGTLLGVADKGVYTTLDAAFATISTAQLTESCVAAIVARGERFVCSPANDWDHISYVFDMRSGRLLNTSAPTTYQGIHMKSVPGTDDFVTVTYGSPAHFDLHRLTPTSSIDFLGESPDHGAFPVSEIYTVVGNPGTHVLTQTGLLLKIYPDGALPDAGRSQAPFFKDGALGTLGDSQSFVALDKSGSDVYGLVATSTYDNRLCAKGCWLQHIDVTKREIVSTKVHKLAGDSVLEFRHNALASRAWLVLSPPGVDSWSKDPGYIVYVLDY